MRAARSDAGSETGFDWNIDDCGARVPVCPVQAIFPQEELPEKWAHFTQIDADWYAQRK